MAVTATGDFFPHLTDKCQPDTLWDFIDL